MCWTEDNRMQAYVQMNEGTDKGRAAYYGYNTTGERYVRYIGTTINITQNGITFHRPILQSPVLYANSLITLNGKGYTKHYFEGDRRVCSKLGGGFTGRTEDDINDIILTDCITPIGDYSFIHHFHILERSVTETNDIPMVKMGFRCKKTPCSHQIYNSFLLNLCTSLHVNNLVTNSPSDGNGRGASQRQLSQMGIKQNSWKVW